VDALSFVGDADPAHPAHVTGGIARHVDHRDAARDRLAIQTVVAPFQEELIRKAVETELQRDGQCISFTIAWSRSIRLRPGANWCTGTRGE